jgi:hypothetical protein
MLYAPEMLEKAIKILVLGIGDTESHALLNNASKGRSLSAIPQLFHRVSTQ